MSEWSEQYIVGLIKPIHDARRLRSEADTEDKKLSRPIKQYLQTLPEGERVRWDMEHDPPIGVGLEETTGRRWLDTSALDDETLIWAARNGILTLNAPGYDAQRQLVREITEMSEEARRRRDVLDDIFEAIRDGGGEERLVMLPKRGQK